MPLTPGQSLTHYEILGPLGAGGMGEVYRARDTRLEREVAIKVLPEHFADDDERLRRFEREAKTLASLNHPNVAGIHGIDQVGDTCFLAMELVAGEDLAAKLARGPLPIDEALDVCRQIAAGLEAAHEAGVVHRDLKPANVRVTPDGVVKVLDFGLAKPLQPKTSNESGTRTAEPDSFLMTEEGLVLGTPTYMSPEQARGKPVDRRTDIWAFGCVLYECLTGERAFLGDSLTDVLSAIVSDEPGWAGLPASTPARVRRLLHRCLDKDPRRRLRDVGEARIELESVRDEPETAVAVEPIPQLRRLRLVTALALALAVALGALAAWALRSGEPAESAAIRRLSIANESLSVAGENDQRRQGLDISRDGKLVAFVGKDGIFLRRMDQAGAAPVPGTSGAEVVGMSPDGDWLGFGRGNRVLKVPLGGGMPIEVAELPGSAIELVSSIAWSRDGNIYFTGDLDGYHALFRVPERGGTPELVLDASDGQGTRRDMTSLQLIDDARKLLFTVIPGDRMWRPDNAKVVVLDLDSGEETVVADAGGFARYIPSGHLLVAQGSDDFTIEPFDIERLESTGPRVPYRAGLVGRKNGMVVHLAFALDGTMVHEAGEADSAARTLIWFGPDGEHSALPSGSRRFTAARLSDDGDQVAVTVQSDQGQSELWLHDVTRGGLTKLTVDDHDYQYPTWTPDGQSLIYLRSLRGQNARVHRWNVLGGEEPQELMDPGTLWYVPEDVSPDGQHLVGFLWDTETDKHWDIVVASLQGDPTPRRFAASAGHELCPRFSPDGRWIAYESDRTGSSEVYLKRFPEQGAAIQVSRSGGTRPLWDPSSGKLYFYDEDETALMAVDVELGPQPGAGIPERVGAIPPELAPGDWDPWGSVAADGRLLLVRNTAGSPSHIDVVLNWFEELRRLAPR